MDHTPGTELAAITCPPTDDTKWADVCMAGTECSNPVYIGNPNACNPPQTAVMADLGCRQAAAALSGAAVLGRFVAALLATLPSSQKYATLGPWSSDSKLGH